MLFRSEQLEWEVTAILNHNIVQNKSKSKILVEFKVQWKGVCEDSWHEFSDIEGCLESLELFANQLHSYSAQTYPQSS